MAQTKKKRRSKHRGTAAGTIERRGRTGRPAPPPDPKQARREARRSRLDKPPTWQNAFLRGGLAAGAFFLLAILVFGQAVGASAYLAVFALLIYVPLGYYTDAFIYRRGQKRKAEAKGGGK